MNGQIRASRVHLIMPDGKSRGEMKIEEALSLAKSEGLDLVEVSPSSKPPIVKIANWGKIKYQEKKKRAGVKVADTKEIRMRFNTGEHDSLNKQKLAKKFLSRGHKVRISMFLRGRERQFKDEAIAKIKKFIEIDGAKIELSPKYEFGKITSMITSNNNGKKSKN